MFVLFFPEKMTFPLEVIELEKYGESSRHRILFQRSGALQRTSWQYEGYTAVDIISVGTLDLEGMKLPHLECVDGTSIQNIRATEAN